jgi:Prohead core protein serine protease
MKFIREISEDQELSVKLIESTNNKKKLYLEGIFLQGNKKNRNGRIYITDNLQEEIKNYTNKYINERRSLGELGHPAGPQINPERSCHIITELVRNGDDFIGRSEVLEDLPMGKILKGLLEANVKVGVSSRGMGSLVSKGDVMEVQDDFKLVTIDVVMDPSAPDAWVSCVLENVEWTIDPILGWRAQEITEIHKKTINNSYKSISDKDKLRLFEEFVSKIKVI